MGPPLEREPDQNALLLATDNPPESVIGSSEDFESDGSNSEFDPDADVANTHLGNDELKNKKTTEECFKIFKGLKSLEDKKSREQIGSIPSRWCNEAIPLFEHDNAGYQLHFSYTWMEAIHTYTSTGAQTSETSDWYLHCLAGVTEKGDIEIVTRPLTIIPLGKLFKNASGRSNWTGYEMFVSEALEVWIIYVPNEYHSMSWNTVDTDFFVPSKDQSHQTGTRKLVQFWPSLNELESATFEDVQRNVSKSNNPPFMDHFYLLEISIEYPSDSFETILSRRSSVDTKIVHLGLISEKIHISWHTSRLACCQLLLLAKENADNAFVKLSPLSNIFDRSDRTISQDTSLLWRAAINRSYRIVDMILESGNVDSYANRRDFSDVTLLHVANRFEMQALVKLILDRIQPNAPDQRGITPFMRAIKRYGRSLVQVLLETGRVDVNQRDENYQTPLDFVKSRFKDTRNNYALWLPGGDDVLWAPGDRWVWGHTRGQFWEMIRIFQHEYDLPGMRDILEEYTEKVAGEGGSEPGKSDVTML